LALQLISPPKKPAPPEVIHGPATPPVEGFDLNHIPAGISQQFLLDAAWTWRNTRATPEEQIPVRVLSESQLLEMEKVSPQWAAFTRQEIAETIASNKRMKLTRTIARIQKLIVDQYGWPERD
jgi:hypothetical protein